MHRIEAYIRLAIIFIVLISILYLPILFILKKKGKSPIRQLSYIGVFCSFFLIVFATILFVPMNFHPEEYILNLSPFNWLENTNSVQQFIVEKIPNIILFIPLGFFIPIVFKKQRKLYKTLLLSFSITFGVEFIQFFIGRSADIVDIITNLFGTIIGYTIYKLLNSLCKSNLFWNILTNKNES